MAAFIDRLQHAWNAFTGNPKNVYSDHGNSSYIRPDRTRFTKGNERSIVSAVYNRIALDVSQITFEHVRLDTNKRYKETVNSGLNNCLTIEANKDQSSRLFIQDIVVSMLDEGCCAAVPIDTTINPEMGSYDIDTIRVGKIIEWMPDKVKVRVYNDAIGQKQEIVVSKSSVAIFENPFYSVMNEPNSTLKRLTRKLVLLDDIDEQSSAGKLDLIIQLPYVVKSPARKAQAEERRKDIEMQLSSSKYGIAYTDGTEHITQLNRSLENNLMEQIQYLTGIFYGQLGITPEIMNGTASEEVMRNYESRTIEPIVSTIVDEMRRKFLTKTARTQKQTIMFYRDPFRLVPVNQLADIADKMTRNEILSSNEVRQIIGLKPVDDAKADELRNKNINAGDEQTFASTTETEDDQGYSNQY